MTGEGERSGESSRVDEDPFEKQMRLGNEAREAKVLQEVRASPCKKIRQTTG